MNLDSPVWRVAGSAVSWLLFGLSFTAFCLGLLGVLQAGGTCADGGPFVIRVHCPENTDIFTLGGVYGGLAAVFVALLIARGFGTRLVVLAWPILFLTLSLPFLISGLPFVIGGIVFLIMAIVPLFIEWRTAGPQRTFLGITNTAGARFIEPERARASMMSPGTPNPPDAIAATPGDWALSLGLAIIPAVVGIALAFAAFNAA